ncbi:MAG TPA: hypothetical protein VFI44_04720 [Ornithinibacter sp.]|nr:hypothetical protein [Ornithinibacter sp.]
MSRRACAALLLVTLLALGAPAVTRAATLPGTPTSLKAVATIEGVRLTWEPPAWASGQPSPTGWIVTRTGAGIDRSWTITTAGWPWQLDDDELAAGVTASYTVRAVTNDVEGAPTDPVTSAKVADPRPFSPARQALTLTWGREDLDHQSAALLDTEGDTLEATLVAGGVAITRTAYSGLGPSLTVPWPVSDGDYAVGTGAGQLDVSAAGHRGTCTGAGGSVRIAHATPTRSGWWAAVSIDADLTCSDGSTLRASGRLSTPETVTAVAGPRVAAIGAAPGSAATVAHVVRNVGQDAVTLTDARLIGTGQADASGVLSVDLGSCRAATLAPGDACSLSVGQARPVSAPSWVEYTARIVVSSTGGDTTVGAAIGTDREELAGPQDVVVKGGPGLTTLEWRAGTANSFSTYTILDADGRVLGSPMSSSPIGLTDLDPGAHVLRVRQVLDDGRVYTSAPRRVVIPEEWLFVDSGGTGVRAAGVSADPDVADGLKIAEPEGGLTRLSHVSLASSPTRAEHVGFDRYSGSGWFFTPRQVQRSWFTGPTKGTPRYRPDGAVLAAQLSEVRDGDTVVEQAGIVLRDQATGVVTPVPGSTSWALADWAPDGRSLLVVPVGGPGLHRMDPVTGATSPVPGAGDAGTARVSRTGRVAVYRYSYGTLYEIPLTGGVQKDLGIYAWGRDFTWDPTGTRIAVGSASWMTTGTGELWDVSGTPTKIRDLPTSRSLSWYDPVSSAPTPAVGVPAWTTATPTLSVSATDPDDAAGGLRTECRLDGSGSWVPCAGSWKPGTLAAGTHAVLVRASDPAGVAGDRTTTWRVDAARPTASLTALPSATLTTSIRLTWTGSDSGGSGLSRYDVRYRRAATGSGLGSYTYPSSLQATTARSGTLAATAGHQYCVSVRARDIAGNVGAWSAERCTVVALDDRSLSAGRGWSRGTSSSYVFGTWTRTTTSKASLTRSGVSARQVGIVATTCSGCGSLDVWVGGTYAGRVSLAATSWRPKQVKWLPTFSSTRTGTVTVRSTSTRLVVVDGLLVRH